MGTRRNICGRYVEVRDKNTSKGKKGTIMKNWSSKKKIRKKRVPIKIYRDSGFVILIFILLLLSYKYLI